MATADLELCYLTASEALARFKARTLSPVELLDAQIARAEAINPKVNAITYDFFDRAREQAKKAEAKYGQTDGRVRALEGVPVAIKDFHPVKGEITTFGSKIFKDFRPDYTAATVDRLLRAGAIMHMRTTSPEFAYSGATHSPLWGITPNPWNLEYTSGGSSGGAGAAVAGGMTTLADGTDGGGSIRIPASACGLFGYKPPFGRNPLDRDHPMETILHYGPIVRSVADAALMQNVMSGPHPDDLCSLPNKVRLPATYDDIRGWKVAFSDGPRLPPDRPGGAGEHAACGRHIPRPRLRGRRGRSRLEFRRPRLLDDVVGRPFCRYRRRFAAPLAIRDGPLRREVAGEGDDPQRRTPLPVPSIPRLDVAAASADPQVPRHLDLPDARSAGGQGRS